MVILTLSKNNPIESAKEARFKEDIRAMQDELSMYISKEYTKNPNTFNTQDVNFEGESLVQQFESTKKYKDKVKIVNGKVIYIGKDRNEKIWAKEIEARVPVPIEWQKYIDEVTPDGVPIPKGFTYLEGSKEEGTVIEDENHNEFVWIPVDGVKIKYEKLKIINGFGPSRDDTILNGIDETADVEKYGGFYIGRYEATTPDGTETTKKDLIDIPTCMPNKVVWTNINGNTTKSCAEKMYTGDTSSVLSGLLTGKAWDTVCKYIEEDIILLNPNYTINDSRYYGNYNNSESPANEGNGIKQNSGSNNNWKLKNIYDFAGNVWEYTDEFFQSVRLYRGGSYSNNGEISPVSNRSYSGSPPYKYDEVGFRVRLYIKTD